MGESMKTLVAVILFFSFSASSTEVLLKEQVSKLVKKMDETKQEVEGINKAKEPCPIPKAVIVQEVKLTELTKPRDVSSFTSSCLKSMKKSPPKNFKESISLAVQLNAKAGSNPLSSHISKTYNSEKWTSDVGLYSHPMCESIDEKLAARNSSDKKARAKKVSGPMSSIPKHFNKVRNLYLDAVAKKDKVKSEKYKGLLDQFYTTLLGVLANHESLSTADNSTSKGHASKFGAKYGVKNFKKPPGVKLYYDKAQSKDESKRNVGLYQLPMSGNVAACVKAWNERVGSKNESCMITKTSKKDMFLLNSASDQLFNAFCGANKLVQSFGVQVNSNKFEVYSGKARRTHKDNYDFKNKKLKEGSKRCVSLFTHTSNTYNHFGTLGFTTKNNTVDVVKDVQSIEGIK